MAFLGSVLGLVGSMVGGGNIGARPGMSANIDPLLAQSVALRNKSLEMQMTETMKTEDTQQLITRASGQSARGIMRAAMLADIVKQHEGLMQSIQSAESSHIKGSFDLVKNS